MYSCCHLAKAYFRGLAGACYAPLSGRYPVAGSVAQRTVELSEEFFDQLRHAVKNQLESSMTSGAFVTTCRNLAQHTSKDMSEHLLAHQQIEMKIPPMAPKH